MSDARLERVIHLLEATSGQDLWFGGATVMGSLRGVPWETAAWKPAPDRHSIWELVLHIAYWKYSVTRNLTGVPHGSFPRSPANFPRVPSPANAAAWEKDRRLLKDQHAELCAGVRAFDPAKLDEPVPEKPKWSWLDLLDGIVMHDTYHTGQIQLMKRLHRSLQQG